MPIGPAGLLKLNFQGPGHVVHALGLPVAEPPATLVPKPHLQIFQPVNQYSRITDRTTVGHRILIALQASVDQAIGYALQIGSGFIVDIALAAARERQYIFIRCPAISSKGRISVTFFIPIGTCNRLTEVRFHQRNQPLHFRHTAQILIRDFIGINGGAQQSDPRNSEQRKDQQRDHHLYEGEPGALILGDVYRCHNACFYNRILPLRKQQLRWDEIHLVCREQHAKTPDFPMIETNTTSAEYLIALGGVQRYPSREIELCIIKNFLRPAECERLIELIDEKRRPSTIADANGDDYFRTSETCDLDHNDLFVTEIDDKICNFADIDAKFGEPLQGQRYAVGQEFKAHTDYFDPDGLDFQKFCTISGQRTWTFMIYLNEPDAGGATRFTHLNKKFVPSTGTLLCWNNMRADGTVNDRTMHHGMKVRSGTKYVITKWYRERPWPWSTE